jgi:hypothetical protein
MVDTASKVHQKRVRRMAERQNLRLIKIGRRDTLAHDYGLWLVVGQLANLKPKNGRQCRGSADGRFERPLSEPMTLGAIETWLSTPTAERQLAG